MKVFKQILVSMLFAVSLSATAEFVTIERAYEVPLQNFRMAGTSVGALAFKRCDDCDRQVIRVTPGTRYVFNREQVEFAEFRKALTRVNDRASRTIIVLHHLESDTVSAVTLNL